MGYQLKLKDCYRDQLKSKCLIENAIPLESTSFCSGKAKQGVVDMWALFIHEVRSQHGPLPTLHNSPLVIQNQAFLLLQDRLLTLSPFI